jgi:DNA-binding MurR/RpiR family transcriptional regulator
MPPEPQHAQPSPDWESLEAAYRAGAWPVRELARRFGVPEATIRYRAKRLGWIRTAAFRQAIHTRLQAQLELPPPPDQTAEALLREAEEATNAFALALETARRIIRRLYEAAEAEQSPQALRVIAEALDRSVSTLTRIHAFTQPEDNTIVIERSPERAEAPASE